MNSYTLQINGADELLVNIIKGIVANFKAEIKIKTETSENGYTKEFEDEIEASINEIKRGEFSSYKSIDELKKDIL
ncbi:MAG: hypothetical protein SO164_03365 [Campylobacter sp.]|nr:hypothetical protein [Campylobacter sp.]